MSLRETERRILAFRVLVAQARALQALYVRNRGSKHQFVAVVSANINDSVNTMWDELGQALDVLDPPEDGR